MKTIKVHNCDDCPALWENMEFPETRCTFAKQSWGMGYHEYGNPSPSWCPLKSGSIVVELVKR